MLKNNEQISKVKPNEIQLYWEKTNWQPFKGYTLYLSPNKEYHALINNTMNGIAIILSKNRIEHYNPNQLYELIHNLGGWI